MSANTRPAALLLLWFVLFPANSALSKTTYEEYITTPPEQLAAQTKNLRQQIASVFNNESIKDKQQEIDFHQYLSALKKSIFYSIKLSSYAEYKQNMEFARDHEIFQVMPPAHSDLSTDEIRARKKFISEKYNRMTADIKEEMATYIDLINLNLDECETMIANDLDNIMADEGNRNVIHKLTATPPLNQLKQAEHRLSSHWPKIAARVMQQLAIWEKPISADCGFIVKPEIIEAL